MLLLLLKLALSSSVLAVSEAADLDKSCLYAASNPHMSPAVEKMTADYHQRNHHSTPTPPSANGKMNIRFLDRRFITKGANQDWKQGDDSSMTCAEVGEIPNTFMCFTKTSTISNIFLRASIYLEGLRYQKKGTLVRSFGPGTSQRDIPMAMAGADIPNENAVQFYKHAESQCAKNKDFCNNDLEQGFYSYIANLSAHRKFTWLLAPARSDTASHEIIHGQFFNMPKFQAIARCYYDTRKIKGSWMHQEIAGIFDPSDELLMINEFTAMVLQDDYEYSALGKRAQQFPQLREQLRAHRESLKELLKLGQVPALELPRTGPRSAPIEPAGQRGI